MAYFLKELNSELKDKPKALEMELISAFRKSPYFIQQSIQLLLFRGKTNHHFNAKKEAHLVHEQGEDYPAQD